MNTISKQINYLIIATLTLNLSCKVFSGNREDGKCYYFPGRPESNQMFYASLTSIFPEMKDSDIGMVYGFLEKNNITFFFNDNQFSTPISQVADFRNFKLQDKTFYFTSWEEEIRKKGNFQFSIIILETEKELLKVKSDVDNLRKTYDFSTSFKLSQISAGNSIASEDGHNFENCKNLALIDYQKMSSPGWK